MSIRILGIGLFLLTLGCGEKEDDIIDADGDGVAAEDDCNDDDPDTSYDMDCDGLLGSQDCNDLDENLTIKIAMV